MDSKRLLDTFLDLVRLNSPSRGEGLVAAYCSDTLRGLGFDIRFDQSDLETGSDTGNLIADLPGTVPAHIVLSGHMDCVDPCFGVEAIIENGIIRPAGETVLGADDKAGLAAILESVRCVIESGEDRPDITVLFSTCEELSLLGAGSLASDVFEGNPPCFVFDADGKPGTIVLASPYHYTFKACFHGKAAHAGVEPEEGESATQMAAHAIGSMQLGRLDEETTANVGIIEGGREVNIVPDLCMIMGECRSLDKEKVESCKASITEALQAGAERFNGSVDIDWRLDYEGIHYEEDDPLVQRVAEAARQAGLEPAFSVTGGGADSNVFASKGAQAITLGIGMKGFHSLEEHISVEDLEGCARLAEEIIRSYAN